MMGCFDGVGGVCATFLGSGLTPGQMVKLSGSGTVAPCGDGEEFCGKAVHCGDGACAVLVRGFFTADYTGAAPALGQVPLCGNGQGGVRLSKEADGETWCLVAAVDSSAQTVTVML